MSRHLRRLFKDRSGSSIVEYSVMVGLIGIAGYMFVHGASQLNQDVVASTGSKIDSAWKRALARSAPATGDKVRHAKSDEDRARELQRRIKPAAGGDRK